MALTPAQLTALRTEIRGGTLAVSMAADAAAGNDGKIAAKLNDTSLGETVSRTLISSHEIIGATAPAEWVALSAAEKQRYQTITGAGQVDVSNPNVAGTFLAMFGAGTATRAALIALTKRPASKAEVLFGESVSIQEIAQALRG